MGIAGGFDVKKRLLQKHDFQSHAATSGGSRHLRVDKRHGNVGLQKKRQQNAVCRSDESQDQRGTARHTGAPAAQGGFREN